VKSQGGALNPMSLRVMVALSSGVDSSVSALLCLRGDSSVRSSIINTARYNGWKGKVRLSKEQSDEPKVSALASKTTPTANSIRDATPQ